MQFRNSSRTHARDKQNITNVSIINHTLGLSASARYCNSSIRKFCSPIHVAVSPDNICIIHSLWVGDHTLYYLCCCDG